MHIALESAVGQKAEGAGHLDGIIETPQLDVGLSDNSYSCRAATGNFPSMAARVTGWWRPTILACWSPVGKATSSDAIRPASVPARR